MSGLFWLGFSVFFAISFIFAWFISLGSWKSNFVKCKNCGRLIPKSLAVCFYCKAENYSK